MYCIQYCPARSDDTAVEGRNVVRTEDLRMLFFGSVMKLGYDELVYGYGLF
jgi:hypothetical protein